ncbi:MULTISPECIES: fructoselysine 6-kinase [Anaerococcus]|nr:MULTISPECIES: fructoselysine 6-kinase [Anaerococcus]MDD7767079.1 fructoselysine 6-kinase [Anaerococcus vaginalis]MDU2376104.1 fructoselysine 6-kinase [Anaerococcus vaginalis]MDU6181867.1 fructoselysine 6-kinase [Anaerococcus vaginalis]MDU7432368.1 fructoselysine 6-kinase [Anaerococcus vaginalis]MDY6127356.1 fructoselysine 6-kinase [Anaerococcus sp.]
MKKICCIGDNCIDYYEDINIAKLGGNPVNVSVYIKQLGGESSYIGAVGTDDFGKLMIDGIRNEGVDVSNVQINPGKTAVTQVKISGNERILGDYDEGVMKNFKLTEENRKFAIKHDLVVSGYWGNVEKEFKYFKENKVVTAFDFATNIKSDLTNETLPYIDYAFFSDDELSEDYEQLKEFIKNLYKIGPKMIIVTRGEKGSIVYDGEKFYEHGITPCKVVDTLGAGDSYIAGFLFSIINGKSIEVAMETGAKRSSKTISYDGAW